MQLPVFEKLELGWVIHYQKLFSSQVMDWFCLTNYFLVFYAIVVMVYLVLWKTERVLFFSLLAVTTLFLIISYAGIKHSEMIVEVQPRYLGARDVLEVYMGRYSHILWKKGWGFPSEHVVISVFYAGLLLKLCQRLVERFALIVAVVAVELSTVYIGDHFFSDLLLNSPIGYALFKMVQWMDAKWACGALLPNSQK